MELQHARKVTRAEGRNTLGDFNNRLSMLVADDSNDRFFSSLSTPFEITEIPVKPSDYREWNFSSYNNNSNMGLILPRAVRGGYSWSEMV